VPKPKPSKFTHGPHEAGQKPHIRRAADQVQKDLGSRLRDLRKNLGFSRAKASELAAVDAVHLARIEAGEINPTLLTLTGLALAYGQTLRSLFRPEAPLVLPRSGIRRATPVRPT